jgi:hypothetical protein
MRDDFSSNRHPALSFCLSTISAQTPLVFVARKNRYPLFRIMLWTFTRHPTLHRLPRCIAARPALPGREPVRVRLHRTLPAFHQISSTRCGTLAAGFRLNGTGKPSKVEGVMENWTNAKLCDVANLILGAILFFSPWVFGFDSGRASENAHIAGIVIAILAVAALAAFAIWEEWLNLVVGLWTLVSPWLLGFEGIASAMRVHVAIGAAVAILAAIEIWIIYQNPPRLTTHS